MQGLPLISRLGYATRHTLPTRSYPRNCSSKWPISARRSARLKRPETALRCPTLRPKARKRGLASTTAYLCTILQHFQSLSKGSNSCTRIVLQPRSSVAASLPTRWFRDNVTTERCSAHYVRFKSVTRCPDLQQLSSRNWKASRLQAPVKREPDAIIEVPLANLTPFPLTRKRYQS